MKPPWPPRPLPAAHCLQLKLNAELVYIVVQKRTHCRLFSPDGSGQVRNVPPGTVIDRDITAIGYPNFYMVRLKTCSVFSANMTP